MLKSVLPKQSFVYLGECTGSKADAEDIQLIKKKNLYNSSGTSERGHSQAYVTQRLPSVGKKSQNNLIYTNL